MGKGSFAEHAEHIWLASHGSVSDAVKAELLAADAVKLPDGRLFFAFIQKGGAWAACWVAGCDATWYGGDVAM